VDVCAEVVVVEDIEIGAGFLTGAVGREDDLGLGSNGGTFSLKRGLPAWSPTPERTGVLVRDAIERSMTSIGTAGFGSEVATGDAYGADSGMVGSFSGDWGPDTITSLATESSDPS